MPNEKKEETMAKSVSPSTADAKDIESNKYLAALSYVFILCFVPLLLAKDSKFAQFHAKQGVILFIVEVILSIVDVVLLFVPIFGWLTILFLWGAVIVVSIMACLRALAGESWQIPVIYDWTKKLNL